MSLLAGDGRMDACVIGSVSPAIVPSARTLEVILEQLYPWTFQRDFRKKLQSGEGTATPASRQQGRASAHPLLASGQSSPGPWWGSNPCAGAGLGTAEASALCVLTSPLLSYLCSSFWGTCRFGSTCVWSLPTGQWCCRLGRFTGGTGP